MNISTAIVICWAAAATHLPAQEESHPDQEGPAHNQWRSQCRQILEHAGLLSSALLDITAPPGIVNHTVFWPSTTLPAGAQPGPPAATAGAHPGRKGTHAGACRMAVSDGMFHADLHIHSRFSRACSKNCDPQTLAWWAARKGVTVIGTGDFTHPAWAAELAGSLVPAEPGLLRLRPDLDAQLRRTSPPSCDTQVTDIGFH